MENMMSKFSIPFGLCVDCVECPKNVICQTKEILGTMPTKAFNTVMKHLQQNGSGKQSQSKNKKTRSIKKKNTKSTRKHKRT